MNFTVQVIDTECEQADQSFFVPRIAMQTKSTTQFAQLYGYSEFVASKPPKKYRKATVSGTAVRVAFTGEETPQQCGGAQYTWSGFGEVDFKGVQTASYSKKFYAQCSKQYWPFVPLQLNPFASLPSDKGFAVQFVGYCWPADPLSCATCDPNVAAWPFLGDQTTNVLGIDLAAFRHATNTPVLTGTTFTAINTFAGFFGLSAPPHTAIPSGHHYTLTIGGTNYDAESAFVDPPVSFPIMFIAGFGAPYVVFTDTNNYTAVLSEEYTDADALANATVVTGTGATAATTPRTTGFTSVFTSVVFTLFTSNLIVGKDYLVTVDMWEQGPNVNTHTPKQYGFTATDTTHTITDIIATPADFHTITVRTPTIAFSP
jgi:hypothetical protein